MAVSASGIRRLNLEVAHCDFKLVTSKIAFCDLGGGWQVCLRPQFAALKRGGREIAYWHRPETVGVSGFSAPIAN